MVKIAGVEILRHSRDREWVAKAGAPDLALLDKPCVHKRISFSVSSGSFSAYQLVSTGRNKLLRSLTHIAIARHRVLVFAAATGRRGSKCQVQRGDPRHPGSANAKP